MRPLPISPYSDFMLTAHKKSIHMYYDSILTMFLRGYLENIDEMNWAYITMPHQHWSQYELNCFPCLISLMVEHQS